MPSHISATIPTVRGLLTLNDHQLQSVATLLDTNHDGRLSGDEVSLTLSARGRLTAPVLTTADLAIALRQERVALRQVPPAIAPSVAAMLFAAPMANGLPSSLDANRDGKVTQTEMASALSDGRLSINRHTRMAEGTVTQEPHFRGPADIPVAEIRRSQTDSQAFLIRGNGPAALGATLQGLQAVAAAGGDPGLAAYATYRGIAALQELGTYAGQSGWLTLIGRYALEAIARGETKPQAILAAAGRQVMYVRPDDDGARQFYIGALTTMQAQLAETERGWETELLTGLEAAEVALPLLRQEMSNIAESTRSTGS